jgi:peptide/bleomycin uptake transporter
VFVSFFPRPRLLLLSLVLWVIATVALWNLGAREWGAQIGLPPAPAGRPPIIGASLFWSAPFLWFYLYYLAAVGLFALFWRLYAPHPWMRWSIGGSALILFVTYFDVQLDVAINGWTGPFYNLVQNALDHSATVTTAQFYGEILTFLGIAAAAVLIGVLNRFFVSHYIFRWRTAMNDHYMRHWSTLRIRHERPTWRGGPRREMMSLSTS